MEPNTIPLWDNEVYGLLRYLLLCYLTQPGHCSCDCKRNGGGKSLVYHGSNTIMEPLLKMHTVGKQEEAQNGRSETFPVITAISGPYSRE